MSGPLIGHVTSHGRTFVPCTREIAVGGSIVYRPVRMWHSGTFAGEGILSVNGDSSGCANADGWSGARPQSVVTRLYWHTGAPRETVSAFLSYPNALGVCDEYFWEAYIGLEPERWTGDGAESRMEAAIIRALTARARRVRAVARKNGAP